MALCNRSRYITYFELVVVTVRILFAVEEAGIVTSGAVLNVQ
jgi:hypothetical protein